MLGLALGGARLASWLLAPQLTEGLVLPALGHHVTGSCVNMDGHFCLTSHLKTNSEVCPHHSQKSEQNAVMVCREALTKRTVCHFVSHPDPQLNLTVLLYSKVPVAWGRAWLGCVVSQP